MPLVITAFAYEMNLALLVAAATAAYKSKGTI